MADLKSCPFCGGEAHEFETEHDSEYQYQVQCRGCGAEIAFWSPWTAGAGQRATAALNCVERWNRRALPAASQPEAAPVAWAEVFKGGKIASIRLARDEYRTVPLYAHPTPAPVVPAEGLTVERVEMEDWSMGYAQPADPIWRIVVGGQCADFPTESAALNFADAISALRAQQPAAPVSGVTVQEAGWQPIETAPKNGAFILAIASMTGHRGYSIICWDDDGWGGYTADDERRLVKFPPAYWMPLPEPPALSALEGK